LTNICDFVSSMVLVEVEEDELDVDDELLISFVG
jgi:hypothetical protein